MQLQNLPTFKRPELRTAEAGLKHSKAVAVHSAVINAYDSVRVGLAELDGTDYDFNPNQGHVVVVDRFLDNGPDTAVKVQSAELKFDPDSGEVDRFKFIQDDENSVTYEHKQYDEWTSNNPTFEIVDGGKKVSFELNPNTGLIVGLESS
jgi:hypothetical protein